MPFDIHPVYLFLFVLFVVVACVGWALYLVANRKAWDFEQFCHQFVSQSHVDAILTERALATHKLMQIGMRDARFTRDMSDSKIRFARMKTAAEGAGYETKDRFEDYLPQEIRESKFASF